MSSPTALSDEVLTEQLTRNLQFFGADAQGRVARSFVVVVGLGVRPPRPRPLCLAPPCQQTWATGAYAAHLIAGRQGVGSHAAHFLLRSGVGKLRLIDFDQVGPALGPQQ